VTLVTERLELRPMRAEDATPLLAVFTDPAVMAAFGRGPFTEAEMEAWVARNLQHQDRHGYGLFTIVRRDDGLVIGDTGLEWTELDGEDVAELGYDLRSDAWGHGYATEAAAAVRDHAFERLGLPRLVSFVRASNERSARVAERLGMRRLREIDGGGTLYLVYGIDRPAELRVWD
jgi:[ribosomal protein S5]-alanine N-acetyltransferase